MGMPGGKSYPAQLQTFLGSDYEVFNAGVGGEQSHTIAARQGALDVFTSKELVFPKGVKTIQLGDNEDNGLCLEDGTSLDLNIDGESFRCTPPATIIYIDDVKYRLSVTYDKTFNIYRYSDDEDLTIEKGSKVTFNSANMQQDSYCEIFYIGANDGLKGTQEDIDGLIERYKKMIARHGNDCYFVIIPQWHGTTYDAAFKEAFGPRAINFRASAVSSGMESLRLTPTKEDEFYIKQGKIPPSLMFENSNTDPLHLNEYGYRYLAQLIYENGAYLGYW